MGEGNENWPREATRRTPWPPILPLVVRYVQTVCDAIPLLNIKSRFRFKNSGSGNLPRPGGREPEWPKPVSYSLTMPLQPPGLVHIQCASACSALKEQKIAGGSRPSNAEWAVRTPQFPATIQDKSPKKVRKSGSGLCVI